MHDTEITGWYLSQISHGSIYAGLNGTHASAPGPVIAANATSVQTPGRSVKGTMVTTPFTGHSSVEEYSNVTFNYTQCYSNAPTIRVVIQSQTVDPPLHSFS